MKYFNIRTLIKTENQRLFMGYQNRKCFGQLVGENTFSAIPCRIGAFLGFPIAKAYTSHAFRRSSATLLANTGVDVLVLRKWRMEVRNGCRECF